MRGLDLANALEELKDGHGVMLFEQRVDAVLSQPRRALPERFEPPDVELCLAYCAIFFLKKPHRFRTSTRGRKESSHVRHVRSNVPGSSFLGNVSKYMWPLKLVFCSQRTNSSAMSGCTDPNMRPSSAASRVVPSLSCTPAKRRRFRARVRAAGGAHI